MFFLVFEGLDGSGKSTLMKKLEQHLREVNQSLVMTREPGGTYLGDQIRTLILQKSDPAPTARTELLLYQASRSQHVDLVIKPALDQKKWVLCDRFTASSVAFQGGGRGISMDQVEWLNHFSTNNLVPDLTILLDLSVADSKKRRQGRSHSTGEVEDRIESEQDVFHERVRQGFLSEAKKHPEQWLVLNADSSPDVLFSELMIDLKRRQWLR